jgi:xylulokinase
MRPLLLVIDAGTTSVKAAAFDEGGVLVASDSFPYPTHTPHSGWAQQDPYDYWHAAIKATKNVVSTVKANDIVAIGLCAHMNGSLVVDKTGEPVYPHIIHSDIRSTKECQTLQKIWGKEEIYKRTGNPIAVHLSLPKLLWLKNNHPPLFEGGAWFLNAKDWLRFKLTNNLGATDYSDASLTGLFNQQKKDWDSEIASTLGIPLSMLPSIHRGTEIGGKLSPEAAQLLGLPSGIPVCYGSGDASCATRGALVASFSHAYAAVGSSAWVSVLTDHITEDPEMRMQHFYDIEGELINVCGTVQSAGSALDWAAELLAPDLSFEQIEKMAATLGDAPSPVLFLPYLSGERTPWWDAFARGAFVGLSANTDAATLLRSVYDGIAFALKQCVKVYSHLSISVKQFSLLGGTLRGNLLASIIAQCLNMRTAIHPWPTHATALGAAFGSAVAVGLFPNVEKAIQQVNTTMQLIEPDKNTVASYEKQYQLYTQLYPSLQHISRGEHESISH